MTRLLCSLMSAWLLLGAIAAYAQVGQITRPGALFPGSSAYTAQGVIFSGTAYASHSGNLTGSTSSKSGLASLWIKDTAATGAQHSVIGLFDTTGSNNYFLIAISSSTGRMFVQGWNSSHALILSLQSSTNFSSAAAWSNVIMSWNLATPRCQVYTNDVSDTLSSPTCTNDTIAYAAPGTPNAYLGAQSAASNVYAQNIADLQIWFGVDVDISVTTNRRNFIDGSGNAVNPSVASGALGTPIVLQKGTPSSWQTNAGSGGGFAIQAGTITAAATNPP